MEFTKQRMAADLAGPVDLVAEIHDVVRGPGATGYAGIKQLRDLARAGRIDAVVVNRERDASVEFPDVWRLPCDAIGIELLDPDDPRYGYWNAARRVAR